MEAPSRIGIVTVSDRASRGEYQDLGGPAIVDYLNEVLSSPWEPVSRVVPDEQQVVSETLIDLADNEGCSLIVTTGGTGPALRDITPEATEAVCTKTDKTKRDHTNRPPKQTHSRGLISEERALETGANTP